MPTSNGCALFCNCIGGAFTCSEMCPSSSTGAGVAGEGGGGAAGAAGSTQSGSDSGAGGTSTTSSTGNDAGAPGCVPARLIDVNIADSGVIEVGSVDPSTGVYTMLDMLPSVGVVQAFSAYDPATKHVYELGDDLLFTIDGSTGAVLGSVEVDINDIYNPLVDNAGRIIVAHFLPDGSSATATVDPTTGVITDLAPLLPSMGFEQGIRAFHRASDRIYDFVSPQNVVTIDASTGALVANVAVAQQNFANARVNNAGKLVGVIPGPGAEQIATLDPMTGVVTYLAPIPGVMGFEQGICAFDPCTNTLYEAGDSALLVFDASTGALLNTLSIPQNFIDFEAVW